MTKHQTQTQQPEISPKEALNKILKNSDDGRPVISLSIVDGNKVDMVVVNSQQEDVARMIRLSISEMNDLVGVEFLFDLITQSFGTKTETKEKLNLKDQEDGHNQESSEDSFTEEFRVIYEKIRDSIRDVVKYSSSVLIPKGYLPTQGYITTNKLVFENVYDMLYDICDKTDDCQKDQIRSVIEYMAERTKELSKLYGV